jgi:ABC-type polar amino acid transport system ATPase subunit
VESGALLRAENLHKRYDGVEVLHDVSFEVRRGQVKVIIGPSGSGKSTLLRCLALLEPVDAGDVYLENRRLGWKERGGRQVRERERELAAHRSEIGMVFQRFNLFHNMTALQNVMLGLTQVRKLRKAQAREQAQAFLARVDLTERANAYPDELSGGQQQRVAIARALVAQPLALLMDEPLSNLDDDLKAELCSHLLELHVQLGFTLVYVTHSKEEMTRIGTRAILLRDGKEVSV